MPKIEGLVSIEYEDNVKVNVGLWHVGTLLTAVFFFFFFFFLKITWAVS